MRRFKKHAAAALVATLVLTNAPLPQFAVIQPAQAQTPTIDLSSLAKLKEIVGTVNQQLGQLTQIFNTVNQINKVIGMVGSGNISGILGMLGLDVGNITKCIGAVKGVANGNFGSGMSGIQNVLGGLSGCSSSVGLTGIQPSIPGLDAIPQTLSSIQGFTQQYQQVANAFKSGATVATASQGLKQGLYLDSSTSGGVSQQSVENTNAIRGIVARQSAVDAMAVAVQGKTYLQKAPEDIKSLSESAKNSKDLRGDISVNNAIMLKILEQLQQQNAQLSALTQMRSSGFIANDAHTFSGSNTSK
ncbi:hypothetical protein GCM10019059_39720 [Camelimonas fluminis]|uniref:Conjugal transfer protein n=1 Tax=Camelimonas fluminis TaxID=1576911 RepID=A0ABV7UEY9_9HYPH|nr:hypothetical protein [Camelimonas fluminis]GHE76517.1 hypothetical protein GCM10019059_39720 [Camelimonas fluminis]